jgi:pilus assembly protein CpaB
MNKRLLSVLIFALAVSAVASFILYRMISAQMTASAKVVGNSVLVASHNLELGALIKDGDLKMAEWGGTVPQGALIKPEDAIGRGVMQPILENEPIVESRIAARGAGAGLASTIPPGMRAVAVRVNDIVGVAGFVVPGTHVDILIAGNPPGGNTAQTGTLTKTLLQNVEVLSAGQNIQKDAEGKPVSVGVVNMLVTPEQAEILSLASNETRIQLIMRNPMDKDVTKTPGTAIANLFNGTKPPPSTDGLAPKHIVRKVAPAPPPIPPLAPVPPIITERIIIPITVEMIHGASKAQVQFKPEDNDKEKKPEER